MKTSTNQSIKNKLLICIALFGTALSGNAQPNSFPATGNAGVGTSSPATNFEIAGSNNGSSNNSWINFDVTATSNPKIFSKGWNASLDLYTYTIQGSPNLGQLHLHTNGNVGIGTNVVPSGKLSIYYPYNVAPTLASQAFAPFVLNNAGTEITMGVDSNAPFSSWLQTKNNNVAWNLTINPLGGNVGIGTTNPQNKLDVNGTIRAKEVKVETDWADFVFTPTYKLRPLSEVEQFIKTNGHLPEIPKAEEVQQNGVNLGEMQTKLLQKVEELTLYSIELKKENIEQSKENAELKKEIKDLKELINNKLK